MGTQECRICLAAGEESELCEPCACSGHLRYAHFTCAQQWINVCPRADRDTCEVRPPLAANYALAGAFLEPSLKGTPNARFTFIACVKWKPYLYTHTMRCHWLQLLG
jgi:hypothetical protein